jgi:hypothetical protein
MPGQRHCFVDLINHPDHGEEPGGIGGQCRIQHLPGIRYRYPPEAFAVAGAVIDKTTHDRQLPFRQRCFPCIA